MVKSKETGNNDVTKVYSLRPSHNNGKKSGFRGGSKGEKGGKGGKQK